MSIVLYYFFIFFLIFSSDTTKSGFFSRSCLFKYIFMFLYVFLWLNTGILEIILLLLLLASFLLLCSSWILILVGRTEVLGIHRLKWAMCSWSYFFSLASCSFYYSFIISYNVYYVKSVLLLFWSGRGGGGVLYMAWYASQFSYTRNPKLHRSFN